MLPTKCEEPVPVLQKWEEEADPTRCEKAGPTKCEDPNRGEEPLPKICEEERVPTKCEEPVPVLPTKYEEPVPVLQKWEEETDPTRWEETVPTMQLSAKGEGKLSAK